MDIDKKRKCCLPICGGEKFDLVHKLPMATEQATYWKNILSSVLPELQTLPCEEIRKKYFVCYRHFKNADYKNIESRNLNKTAYPSINLSDFSENHACPRLRSLTMSSIQHLQFTTCGTVTPIHLPQLEASPKKPEKRIIDSTITPQIQAKRMKIGYQQQTVLPATLVVLPSISEQAEMSQNSSLNEETYSGTALIAQDKQSIPLDDNDTDPVAQRKEATVLEELLLKPEDDERDILESPKKLVALFEVTPKQLIELQEQFRNNTVQLLNRDPENVEKDTMATCDYIEIVSEKYPNPIKINHFWLRDHCRCGKCYDSETFQRKFNLLSIPLDIVPQSYNFDEECLNVLWDDGHKSVYSMDFLYTNQYEVQKSLVEQLDRVLWDNAAIKTADYARVKLSDLICTEEPIRIVMKSLIKYGFAFIENVPANVQSTEMAIKRLFPIKKTLFGEMWTFSDNKDHSDTAYTKDFLPAHTDNTYFNDASGLQVLHCIQHTGTGGLSLLQDGFKALQEFKEKHPDSYQRLCELSIPAEYIEGAGQHHKYTAPIIRLDPVTQKPEQIRFNTLDRAPLNTIPLERISQFYADYRKLTEVIQDAEKEWWFKLEPGTVLIFDNWRLMHGRSEYQGKRIMSGCYVERTDFMSLARVLKLVS